MYAIQHPFAKNRTRFGRSEQLALLAFVAGVALEFLLDPQQGRRRRSLARNRTAGALRRTFRRSRRGARIAWSYARGYSARIAHAPRSDSLVAPNDETLARKVETELFRPADVPKGQIDVNVQNGVVQLRGEVPEPEMIDDLVDKARSIAGVRDVENLLHLPNAQPQMHQ